MTKLRFREMMRVLGRQGATIAKPCLLKKICQNKSSKGLGRLLTLRLLLFCGRFGGSASIRSEIFG